MPEHLREQLRGQVNAAVPRGQQAAPPPPRPRAPACLLDRRRNHLGSPSSLIMRSPTSRPSRKGLNTNWKPRRSGSSTPYQREQKGIQEVLRRVAELFKDHADLLREFTYFYQMLRSSPHKDCSYRGPRRTPSSGTPAAIEEVARAKFDKRRPRRPRLPKDGPGLAKQ